MSARTMYMHTIDGRPAYYDDTHGPSIYFVRRSARAGRLVPSLAQLHREQARYLNTVSEDQITEERSRLNYVRVEVPA